MTGMRVVRGRAAGAEHSTEQSQTHSTPCCIISEEGESGTRSQLGTHAARHTFAAPETTLSSSEHRRNALSYHGCGATRKLPQC